MILAVGLASVMCALVSLQLIARAWMAFRVPRLADVALQEPERWPTLSVVIPACNEADTLAAALGTLLEQRYPELEIVVVNDRSTDSTGEIADGLAAADPRVEVVHVEDLPEGWLGKVNALARGLERARGELVLFADADTRYAAKALERAVAVLVAHDLEHLTLLPRFLVTGPLQGAMMAAFFDGYVERTRGRRDIVVPRSSSPFGFGAFNLLRRRALEETEGLAWLRMDIADDLALGALLQPRGRSGFAVAPDALCIEYYPSLLGCVRGWSKNAFGILAQFSLVRALPLALGTFALGASPVVVLLQDTWPWLWALPGALAVAAVLNALAARARYGRDLLSSLLEPLALPIMAVTLLYGAWRCTRDGGVVWRGTLYPTEALRRGQRARFI